eukprot:UN00835
MSKSAAQNTSLANIEDTYDPEWYITDENRHLFYDDDCYDEAEQALATLATLEAIQSDADEIAKQIEFLENGGIESDNSSIENDTDISLDGFDSIDQYVLHNTAEIICDLTTENIEITKENKELKQNLEIC